MSFNRFGTELYKCLVRPHLEFAVPAWATTSEKGIQLLEKMQGECLRWILGAKMHSSTEALSAFSNVLPVRIRIQELAHVTIYKFYTNQLTARSIHYYHQLSQSETDSHQCHILSILLATFKDRLAT